MQDGQTPVAARKTNRWKWILWWQVDPVDVEDEARHYKDTPILKSSRGIATALLLFSALLTFVLVITGVTDQTAYLDVGLMMGLALFIRFGHRWAMIAAMVLWTFEKMFQVVTMPATAAFAILWWAVYMHALWMAFKVEQARRTMLPLDETVSQF